MPRRDFSNLREVTDVEVDTSMTSMAKVVGEAENYAGDIVRQGEEAELTHKLSGTQLQLNKLNSDYQTKYEGQPFAGKEEYETQRQAIFDRNGAGINPMYARGWQNGITKLSDASDASLQSWGIQQTRKNTVTSINDTMLNNFQQANIDGAKFAKADTNLLDNFLNFRDSRSNLEELGKRNLGEITTGETLKNYDKNYMKSFLIGVAEANPAKAMTVLQDENFAKNFTPMEHNEFIGVIKRTEALQKYNTSLTHTGNTADITDLINDNQTSFYDKRLQIDRMELSGQLPSKVAAQARRVITDARNLDAVDDAPIMTDIVNKVYDLNSHADLNSSDYLMGVQNIQHDILEQQANGTLSDLSVKKLNNQMRTLTNKRLADATKAIGESAPYRDATQSFDDLPPEQRGAATRQLFLDTQGQELTDQQIKFKAFWIKDGMNKQLRQHAQGVVQRVINPVNDDDFIRQNGITEDQITATMNNRNMTRQQVLDAIKKGKRKAKTFDVQPPPPMLDPASIFDSAAE